MELWIPHRVLNSSSSQLLHIPLRARDNLLFRTRRHHHHRQSLFSTLSPRKLSVMESRKPTVVEAANGSPATSSLVNDTVGVRIGEVKRVTKETNVAVKINLDGVGLTDSSTGIPFLDHMLDQLASHGLFDVHVKATGDTHIDDHHTNEDVALAIGTALLQALGDRKGINRFGDFSAPLDEALVHVALDLSGRPHISYDLCIPTERVGTYDTQSWKQEMSVLLAAKIHLPVISNSLDKGPPSNEHKVQSRFHVTLPSVFQDVVSPRRHFLTCGVSIISILAFNYGLTPILAWAGDESNGEEEGVVGAITTLFDPDEKTKSGKVLPKAYLKSAREVVKTLRESVNEDPKDMAKFRRTADAAKASIREYIGTWRGQQKVVNEVSYMVIEKVIRSLASFYSKAGPSAPLPEVVKSEILSNLNTAESSL